VAASVSARCENPPRDANHRPQQRPRDRLATPAGEKKVRDAWTDEIVDRDGGASDPVGL
jgi:hypothetical protein